MECTNIGKTELKVSRMCLGTMMFGGQTFPFAGWRKKHRDLSKVTVRDLVMADGINRRAVKRLYGSVLKAFYRSGEYDGREYRYVSYDDLLRQKEEERKRKEEA